MVWFIGIPDVFSTYVEVILNLKRYLPARYSILHVCGGDPSVSLEDISTSLYSPRMWR